VASARAAKVSWMRLSQRSWTGVSTDSASPLAMEETEARTTAPSVTVSWNYLNVSLVLS